MKVVQHSLGTVIETDSYIGLLGNKEAQISHLQQAFPHLNFKRIKQVHKDRIVHTSAQAIDFSSEADAHYTSEKNLGLCISTADCIPVFIYHHEPRWIAGIHAGWRGVENRIVLKTIQALKRNGCKSENLQIAVGPHIQLSSFEVTNDVRDLLLKCFDGEKRSVWNEISTTKSKVDLHQILKFQLLESGIDLHQTYFEFKDTVTDLSYHSFRRDKESSGRQLSFIALK
ncbi:MAG: peptidoglycan editing factor PgeF [Pseudobdellovibrionaceae bacterium]